MDKIPLNNIFNGKIKSPIISAIYGLTIKRFSYQKIGKMLGLDHDLVRKVAEGSAYKENRSKYQNLDSLRKEVTRRKKYYHKYATPYRLKKIEVLWLEGKGRGKIIKETGYSYDLVKKTISELIKKYGRLKVGRK